MRSRRKRNGDKKHGRNKKKCEGYRYRAVKNKLRKLKRHLSNHSDDFCAIAAIERARVQV